MKKITILPLMTILALSLFSNKVLAEVTTEDIQDVKKITKQIIKLSNKNNPSGIEKYFSEKYTSFDGYSKEDTLKIFKTSVELYPKSKTKEKIVKIEPDKDNVKVYLKEISKTNMDAKGENAAYAVKQKIKGEMLSFSDYAIIFSKEDDGWRVIKDEIYEETTKIMYGEALKTDFSLETPDSITAGKEYTVKLSVTPIENRYLVGSIGHDKVVWPPEKYFDPYRAIDSTGILERVMVANKEGKNEYANSTFAFISPYVNIKKNKRVTEDEVKKAAISGMGILVKRINTAKEQKL